jgi:hypothetical protein
MPRKPKPDTSIEEITIVEYRAAIELLLTRKYAGAIRLVDTEEPYGSDTAGSSISTPARRTIIFHMGDHLWKL